MQGMIRLFSIKKRIFPGVQQEGGEFLSVGEI